MRPYRFALRGRLLAAVVVAVAAFVVGVRPAAADSNLVWECNDNIAVQCCPSCTVGILCCECDGLIGWIWDVGLFQQKLAEACAECNNNSTCAMQKLVEWGYVCCVTECPGVEWGPQVPCDFIRGGGGGGGGGIGQLRLPRWKAYVRATAGRLPAVSATPAVDAAWLDGLLDTWAVVAD